MLFDKIFKISQSVIEKKSNIRSMLLFSYTLFYQRNFAASSSEM